IFFFQAEDGIRDGHVTGVQTCALPISSINSGWSVAKSANFVAAMSGADNGSTACPCGQTGRSLPPTRIVSGSAAWSPRSASGSRSEERRVGKECRSRWWEYEKEKN